MDIKKLIKRSLAFSLTFNIILNQHLIYVLADEVVINESEESDNKEGIILMDDEVNEVELPGEFTGESTPDATPEEPVAEEAEGEINEIEEAPDAKQDEDPISPIAEVVVTTVSELEDAINAGQTEIFLGADITLTSRLTIPSGANITIQSVDGQSFTLFNRSNQRHFLANGNLILKNIILDGQGSGGGVEFSNGYVTLENGGVIRNCHNNEGGAVIISKGTFILDGGVIEHNHANVGGGVYVTGGAFIMKSGTIRYNKATNEGGGITLSPQTDTITIHDGQIIGNSAYAGGGLYAKNNGALKNIIIGDTVWFEDNTAADFRYYSGNPFTTFPNIKFANVSISVQGHEPHPINNYDIGTDKSGLGNYIQVYNVRVHQVDMEGNAIGPVQIFGFNFGDTFNPSTVEMVPNYQAEYYMIGETLYSIDTPQTISKDTDITIFNRSTILTVSFPSSMEFSVTDQSDGDVFSSEYQVVNQSEVPVNVDFVTLKLQDLNGIQIVAEAQNSMELQLNLETGLGFTKNISNIEPNKIYQTLIGTLESNEIGTLSLGGHYVGDIPREAIRPQVELIFSFDAIK